MRIINALKKYGVHGSLKIALRRGGYYRLKHKFLKTAHFNEPTCNALRIIEKQLSALGISTREYIVDSEKFNQFKKILPFPEDYHGGVDGAVWEEKILEHFIAFEILNLKDYNPTDIYIDVAACLSPWAKILRENLAIQSYAIDLNIGKTYKNLKYYKKENATKTSFSHSSVKGMSLQCAYETFINDDDIYFLEEISRILHKGGKTVIVPLYLHTHYCSSSSPEYFSKNFSNNKDFEEKYVRLDLCGVPFSRHYNVTIFYKRIIEKIKKLKMNYNLYALRNKKSIGSNIYCHFILEIIK